jgi:predicted nucleic acid-binding protein
VTVVDASVAVKWFTDHEPLADEARLILHAIEDDPRDFAVPELFMNEVLAVLARLPGATSAQVGEALGLLEGLGLHRVANGHELLATAARFAVAWGVSGDDATYLALASLLGGTWVTADERAAKRVRARGLARVLGR